MTVSFVCGDYGTKDGDLKQLDFERSRAKKKKKKNVFFFEILLLE